jgi:O-antigen ligase
MAVSIGVRDVPPRSAGPLRLIRRSSDLWLAFAMGGGVALLILNLPMPAALTSSIVGAFVLLALVDTRAAVLALILVRSTADVTTTIPLLSASGASNVNANALMSLLIIALGLSHIALNRLDIRRIPLAMPFAAFVGVTFLGIAVAPDHNRALQDWLRLFGTLMVFVLCVDAMRTVADRRWLVRVILLSSIIPLLVGLYQFLTDTGDHYTAGFNRIFGTFVAPSPYGFYLVQLLPLAVVFLAHTRSRLARLGLAAMVPLMLFSIYATETRGAWIGVLVMLIVFMWTRARWTLLLLPLAVGAMYFAVPSVRARISGATSGTCVSAENCQSSVFWRQKQWEDAIRVASPPKLITVGAGLGAVDVTLGNLTHNEYVRLLVEAGALGCIAIFILYRRLLDITLKGYREASTSYQRDLMLAFMMALISRVVMAAADNILDIVVIEWYFWAFAAVIVVESGAYDRFARLRERDHRSGHVSRLPQPAVVSQVSTP